MPRCQCGNPMSCQGKYKFLVLFDIVGDGVAVRNVERWKRCTVKTDRLRQVAEELEKVKLHR